jgi:hypothetical protein
MRKLPALAAGGLALALAGGAIAASQKTHRMDVPLPDGGVVQVEYVGDVAPKVSVAPAEPRGLWAPMAFPGFGNFDNFDGMFEQMDRQMRQMQQIANQPGVPGMNVAGYGSMPAGSSSVSVVSTSNNGVSCTRTTEVVAQGAGKPPKVTTNLSGDCGGAPQAPQAAPSGGSGPIDHT